MEKEKIKEKEPGHKDDGGHYDETLRLYAEERERARTGKVVVRAKELPWRQARMGYTKRFLSWRGNDGNAVTDWTCFIHDIKVHSGKHRHQGAIMLFVLEGAGYTVVDGKKVDWEKGDLIVLPVQPNGCEHQHFNKVPGTPAKWMAFRYHPFSRVLGNLFEHVEDSPDWKGEDWAQARKEIIKGGE
jgi:mannose-6-phosphate isomerase-like protein (cupin superfamily)